MCIMLLICAMQTSVHPLYPVQVCCMSVLSRTSSLHVSSIRYLSVTCPFYPILVRCMSLISGTIPLYLGHTFTDQLAGFTTD